MFETESCCSRSSISSSQILGNDLFLKKLSKHLLNRLQGMNEPLAKDIFFRLRPDLPTHFKSLVTLSSVKCAFFVLSIML